MNFKMFASLLLLGWAASAGEWFPTHIAALGYPPLATQARIEGEVRLNLTVDQAGRVLRADVLSGNSLLARSARDNALLWKFSQRCDASTTTPRIFAFTYVFKLEDKTGSSDRPQFLYDHPYKATVTAKASQWMPTSDADSNNHQTR
jgi:TonB family protein